MEHDVAADMHAAEQNGLGNGPLHRAAGGRHRESLGGSPEGAGGVVVGEACVGMHVADDVHGVRCRAEADHLRVEANGDVDVVFAGKEQECVACCAKFAVLLDGVDLVDLLLNCGRGHGRFEDKRVRSQIGLRGCGRFRRPLRIRDGCHTEQHADSGNRDKYSIHTIKAGHWTLCIPSGS